MPPETEPQSTDSPASDFEADLTAALSAPDGGDPSTTIARLESLLETYPDEPDLLGNLAYCLQSHGRAADAIARYEKYVSIRPDDPEGWLRLGDTLLRTGDRRGARAAYTRLSRIPGHNHDLVSRLQGTHSLSFRSLGAVGRGALRLLRRSPDGRFWIALGRELFSIPKNIGAIGRSGIQSFLTYLNQSLLNGSTYRTPIAPCDLCGSKKFKTFFYYLHKKNVQCPECDLLFVERRPEDGYDVEISFYERDDTIEFFETSWWHDPEHLTGRIDKLRDAFQTGGVEFPTTGSRVFEFGCAEGQVLNYLKEQGVEVAGMEASEPLSEFARTRYGLEVDRSTVSDFAPPASKFDAVLAYHILEHLDRPSALLEKTRDLLKPGGLLFLEIPIPDLTAATLTEQLDSDAGFACMGHMHYFTVETMTAYLEKFGFELLHHYEFLTPMPLGGFLARRSD